MQTVTGCKESYFEDSNKRVNPTCTYEECNLKLGNADAKVCFAAPCW